MKSGAKTRTARSPKQLVALAVFATLGVLISIIGAKHFYDLHGGTASFKTFCNLGQAMNCDVVTLSRFAEVFAGLPLASFAGGWFLALLGTALIARNEFWRREALRLALGLTLIGSVVSLIYFFVMVSIIHTYCLLCLMTDSLLLISLITVITLKPEGLKPHRPDTEKWKLLGGLVVGSLVVVIVGMFMAFDQTNREMPVDDMVNGVLDTAPVAITSSPQYPVMRGNDGGATAKIAPKITIEEFSDFQCPFCRMGAKIVNSVLNRYPNDVQVVFRNFPLDQSCNKQMDHALHPYACEAARAAICANQQGHFKDMYEQLFEHQDELGSGKPLEWAKQLGLDLAKMEGCMASPETTDAIARDVEEAATLSVSSTPTFFINGRVVKGAYPLEAWTKMIDRLLAK